YNIRDMEKIKALGALAALAQETRLDIFRRLVKVGPRGLPAGAIGEHFRLPSATQSFHLKEMRRAGLVRADRHGRQIIYAADFQTMNDLIAYLTEHCCQDQGEANPTIHCLTHSVCCEANDQGADRESRAIRPKRSASAIASVKPLAND
ncbi:MAG: ArsR/SmtB family transcription factor, partial [Gammaproteobacteria bacterium]